MACSYPIVRRNLGELVVERLIEMIRDGELNPGDQFPSERSQMARFAVGRPSVREAMQSLCNWGLATTTHGQLSEVSGLKPRDVIAATKTALQAVILRNEETLAQALIETEFLRSTIQAMATAARNEAFGTEEVSLQNSIIIPLCEMLENIVAEHESPIGLRKENRPVS